jgi:hypothetical protein
MSDTHAGFRHQTCFSFEQIETACFTQLYCAASTAHTFRGVLTTTESLLLLFITAAYTVMGNCGTSYAESATRNSEAIESPQQVCGVAASCKARGFIVL